jgi:hypothetical protein
MGVISDSVMGSGSEIKRRVPCGSLLYKATEIKYD